MLRTRRGDAAESPPPHDGGDSSKGSAGPGDVKSADAAPPQETESRPTAFRHVVDLTHTLTPAFPTFSGRCQLRIKRATTLQRDGWNTHTWSLAEHTGTHLDAPYHKSGGITADLIPAADLVGPLAIVDLRARAAADPDTALTPDDLKLWESRHGPLPDGAIVALWSGWEAHLTTPRFRNAGADGTLHFPGVHAEAADFLLRERHVKGLVVDTLSLDPGNSTEFPVHVRWLGSGRWGVECAARLGDVPPAGALIVVGGPKIAGASGGPSRVFALF